MIKCTDKKPKPFVIWLVQQENFYGQTVEPICDLASTEGNVVRTERQTFLLFGWYRSKTFTDTKPNQFVIWLVQKEMFYGQKAEPFCDLVGMAGKLLRTDSRTNL